MHERTVTEAQMNMQPHKFKQAHAHTEIVYVHNQFSHYWDEKERSNKKFKEL